MSQKRREGMIKILRRIFRIKKRVEKKEEVEMIEDPKKAMDAWMSNNGENWKPNNGGQFNPWGF